MRELQASQSQSTVYKSTELEAVMSLGRNNVCTTVIIGYGVKMKRRLCGTVQCAGCRFFFFSEVDKDVVDLR